MVMIFGVDNMTSENRELVELHVVCTVLCLNFQEEEDRRRERVEDWERHQEGKGYRSKRFRFPVNSSLNVVN